MPSSTRTSTLPTRSKSAWADCQPYAGLVPQDVTMVGYGPCCKEPDITTGTAVGGTNLPKREKGIRRLFQASAIEAKRGDFSISTAQPVFHALPGHALFPMPPDPVSLASGIFVTFMFLCLRLVQALISSHEPDFTHTAPQATPLQLSSRHLTSLFAAPRIKAKPQDSSLCSSSQPKT